MKVPHMKVMPEEMLKLMTYTEVAGYLRISKASVYHMVIRREIPVIKIGRQLRFRRQAIDE